MSQPGGDFSIVGVCSANVQRSPTFEAVVKFAIAESASRSYDRLLITSAGTHVEHFLANDVPFAIQLKMIEAGLGHRLVRPTIEAEARWCLSLRHLASGEDLLGLADRERIQLLFQEIRPLVHGVHLAFRNEALREAGIPDHFIPGPLRPLAPDGGYQLVLPMHPKDALRVANRYNRAEEGNSAVVNIRAIREGRIETVRTSEVTVPPIITYGRLLGISDLPDDPEGGMSGARRQVQYFMDTRQRALPLILEQVARLR